MLNPAAPDRTTAATVSSTRESDWQILLAICGYRLLLAVLLVGLYYSRVAPTALGSEQPWLFQLSIFCYFGAGILTTLAMQWRAAGLIVHATLQFTVDLVGLSLLLLSSGGVDSGLGVLLITPTVGYALVLPGRLALLTAAASTLALFSEEIYRQLRTGWSADDFTAIGILGVIFFATAAGANQMAMRARKSEAQAARVGSELIDLSRINDSIVESMRTAVIVLDNDNRMRAFNAVARRLLRLESGAEASPRLDQVPDLAEAVGLWREALPGAYSPIVLGNVELMPRYTRLATGDAAPILITLEDAAQIRAEAQRMKLVALGRLSASIAHEIRNPLSAIQHASQLLGESERLDVEDQRLLDMIQRHGRRIERIVSDVLTLSRPQARSPGTLALAEHLRQSLRQYLEIHPRDSRKVDPPPSSLKASVRFDRDHLNQVLFNLWDNAFEHGGQRVSQTIGTTDSGAPFLEIRDDGPGIAEDRRDQIFEPFFTTAHGGTGLGLYLARELCEYNHARLIYRAVPEGGACFRIIFARAGGTRP
ncbi:histidine kinase dimerization/phospho-acceptor domain-containing protein [Algiphilus sp. W345]|uniref:histidine kinase n=1 Tax=Banduia mediterranea TaxID=3075609 RepID=A0ABU2WFV1_9GAMM|nr:ATP-binding protein [Algiphilus sp. W345]MDT0496747.1 histidine kinase dimerization/phospho-acceptor domain-containing protein [Algiphilus sp. W345]